MYEDRDEMTTFNEVIDAWEGKFTYDEVGEETVIYFKGKKILGIATNVRVEEKHVLSLMTYLTGFTIGYTKGQKSMQFIA